MSAHTTQPDPALAAVAAIVARAIGLPAAALDVALRPALSHQSNRLYDVAAGRRRLIVKEYLQPDERVDAPRREWTALQRLAPADLAPRPVLLHADFDAELGPLVVYDYLPGRTWGRSRPPDGALAQLAHIWLQLHALPADGFGLARGYETTPADKLQRFHAQFEAYAAWAAADFPPGVAAAEQCLQVLARCLPAVDELASYDPAWCFCRGDARFSNVIERPDGRLGLLDWEDSGLGDAARNVADLLLAPDQEDLLTLAQWQHFLRPYLAARTTVDPGIERRITLYCCLFPVFWLAVILAHGAGRARAGQPTAWSVNGLPVNLRLRRYLARAQAWPSAEWAGRLEALRDVWFFPES